MPCRHCGRGCPKRPRGLCHRCYKTPGVKDLHPPLNAGALGRYYEPTEEEVEATIATQMARLPRWWDEESRRVSAGVPGD